MKVEIKSMRTGEVLDSREMETLPVSAPHFKAFLIKDAIRTGGQSEARLFNQGFELLANGNLVTNTDSQEAWCWKVNRMVEFLGLAFGDEIRMMDYSGRFMYGDVCFAVVAPKNLTFEVAGVAGTALLAQLPIEDRGPEAPVGSRPLLGFGFGSTG